MQAKLGISPIAWWNDDLAALSDDVSLEECLAQARQVGYTGMETGQRFPLDPDALGPVLRAHGITVCGGWFSGRLLDGEVAAEQDRVADQMALFKAMDAPCIVYGETAGTIQGERDAPLDHKRRIAADRIGAYGRRLTEFAEWCAGQGVPITYHHHMGAVIQFEDELDLLMANSGEALPLALDTGHLAFAGGDIDRVIDKHHARINHVHCKDVRRAVLDGLDWSRHSFLDAVIQGAFTVPGDGSLDFGAILKRLADHGYEGWFVVEAEQDPKANPPLEMAEIGHAALMRAARDAGYEVVA